MIGLAENNGPAAVTALAAIGILDEMSALREIFADGRVPLTCALPHVIVTRMNDGTEQKMIGFQVPLDHMSIAQQHKAAELCAGSKGAKDFANCLRDLRTQNVFAFHVSHMAVVMPLNKAGAAAAPVASKPSASAEGGL